MKIRNLELKDTRVFNKVYSRVIKLSISISCSISNLILFTSDGLSLEQFDRDLSNREMQSQGDQMRLVQSWRSRNQLKAHNCIKTVWFNRIIYLKRVLNGFCIHNSYSRNYSRDQSR